MTNSSGAIQSQIFFDSYGRVAKQVGIQSDFQYAEQYFHAASGLSLSPTRAYSPKLGRWLSRDPLQELAGSNLYGYVGNSPTNFNDPFGLQAQFAVPIVSIIIAGFMIIGGAIYAINRYGQLVPVPTTTFPGIVFAKPPTKTPLDIILEPQTKPMKPTSRGPQYSRPGGLAGAQQDFQDLCPEQTKKYPTKFGPGESGKLPGGGGVSIRPGNSKDPTVPTIEITGGGGGDTIKIRYP
jgi:RHS repeat-associated protein